MKNFRNFIPYLLIIFSIFTMAHGEDDDDNALGELAADLMIGVGIAICETSAACSMFMTIIGTMAFLMILCTCLCGSDRDRRELWYNMPSGRRVAGTGAGYYAARRYLR